MNILLTLAVLINFSLGTLVDNELNLTVPSLSCSRGYNPCYLLFDGATCGRSHCQCPPGWNATENYLCGGDGRDIRFDAKSKNLVSNTRCNMKPTYRNACHTLFGGAWCEETYCKCPERPYREPQWDAAYDHLCGEMDTTTIGPHTKNKNSVMEETRCTFNHTCVSMFNAVCKNGFCACETGIINEFGICPCGSGMDRTISNRSGAKLFNSNVFHTAMIVLMAIAGNHY